MNLLQTYISPQIFQSTKYMHNHTTILLNKFLKLKNPNLILELTLADIFSLFSFFWLYLLGVSISFQKFATSTANSFGIYTKDTNKLGVNISQCDVKPIVIYILVNKNNVSFECHYINYHSSSHQPHYNTRLHR